MNLNIAIVTGSFPVLTETFLTREIVGLARRGHRIAVWPSDSKTVQWISIDPQENYGVGDNIIDQSNCSDQIPALTDPLMLQSVIKQASWHNSALTLAKLAGITTIRRASRLTTAIRQLPFVPDLVIAHWAGNPALCGIALARDLGRPGIVTVHARDIWVPWSAGIKSLSGASVIVGCNQAVLDELKNLRPQLAKRCKLIHHGLGVDALSPVTGVERQPGLTVMVGRNVIKKGYRFAISAFSGQTGVDSVRGQVPQAELRYIGDPDYAKFLPDSPEIDGWRSDGKGFFVHGACSFSEVRHWLARAELLIMPGIVAPDRDRDGIPNIALEALAVGTPILATDVGSVKEIVIEKETGKLLPDIFSSLTNIPAVTEFLKSYQLDATIPAQLIAPINTLADAWAKALRSNKEELDLFGENGKRLVQEHFPLDKTLDKWQNTVYSVLE